jgi:hypothetical protein
MDRKQKERLRFYLKARKRADKVLTSRREAQQQKLDHEQRLQSNQELRKQYAQELTALAQESGILSMAEQAALTRRGSLAQEVSYYVFYGLSSSSMQHATGVGTQGELRASHLALRITWEEAGMMKQVEIRVHKKGYITFHNSFLPILPFIWRVYPQVLQKMLASALSHPGSGAGPEQA